MWKKEERDREEEERAEGQGGEERAEGQRGRGTLPYPVHALGSLLLESGSSRLPAPCSLHFM